MAYAWAAGAGVMLASILGSGMGLIWRNISHRANDMILGYAAGVMLTAAFVGLLPTGFAQTDLPGIFTGCAGVVVGAWFISLMDRFVPHMHFENGTFDSSEAHGKTNRVLLLVIAIAIHNIPEGLATGLAFSGGMSQNALLVALSMVIQKIPEGLIVMMPLLKLGMKRGRAFGLCCVVALMMLPGLVLGMLLGTLPGMLVSFFYAFTFGAIVYVISDEVIPESHEHGYQRHATFALIGGILSVMLLDLML